MAADYNSPDFSGTTFQPRCMQSEEVKEFLSSIPELRGKEFQIEIVPPSESYNIEQLLKYTSGEEIENTREYSNNSNEFLNYEQPEESLRSEMMQMNDGRNMERNLYISPTYANTRFNNTQYPPYPSNGGDYVVSREPMVPQDASSMQQQYQHQRNFNEDVNSNDRFIRSNGTPTPRQKITRNDSLPSIQERFTETASSNNARRNNSREMNYVNQPTYQQGRKVYTVLPFPKTDVNNTNETHVQDQAIRVETANKIPPPAIAAVNTTASTPMSENPQYGLTQFEPNRRQSIPKTTAGGGGTNEMIYSEIMASQNNQNRAYQPSNIIREQNTPYAQTAKNFNGNDYVNISEINNRARNSIPMNNNKTTDLNQMKTSSNENIENTISSVERSTNERTNTDDRNSVQRDVMYADSTLGRNSTIYADSIMDRSSYRLHNTLFDDSSLEKHRPSSYHHRQENVNSPLESQTFNVAAESKSKCQTAANSLDKENLANSSEIHTPPPPQQRSSAYNDEKWRRNEESESRSLAATTVKGKKVEEKTNENERKYPMKDKRNFVSSSPTTMKQQSDRRRPTHKNKEKFKIRKEEEEEEESTSSSEIHLSRQYQKKTGFFRTHKPPKYCYIDGDKFIIEEFSTDMSARNRRAPPGQLPPQFHHLSKSQKHRGDLRNEHISKQFNSFYTPFNNNRFVSPANLYMLNNRGQQLPAAGGVPMMPPAVAPPPLPPPPSLPLINQIRLIFEQPPFYQEQANAYTCAPHPWFGFPRPPQFLPNYQFIR